MAFGFLVAGVSSDESRPCTDAARISDRSLPIQHSIVPLWLFGLTIAGIVYGSLYPFEFDFGAVPREALIRALCRDWQADSGFGDVFANVVLFLPFGLFGALAFAGLRPLIRFGVLLGGAALLAFGLQVLQLWLPNRVPEIADGAINMVGTGFGIGLAALPWRRLGDHGRAWEAGALLPALLLGCWLAYLWFPYVPTLDWYTIKQGLKPLLLEPRLEWLSLLRHTVAWLVFAALWRECRLGHGSLVAVAAGAVLLQTLIAHNALELDDVLGVALGLLLWSVVRRVRNPLGPILFLLIALIVVQGVWPLEWQRSSFYWLPFRGFLEGSMLLNFLSLLTKLYFYGALVWLVHRVTRGSYLALIVPVAVTLFVEVAQTRVVGHTAEIADPLLCALIWSAVRALQHRQGPAPQRQQAPVR